MKNTSAPRQLATHAFPHLLVGLALGVLHELGERAVVVERLLFEHLRKWGLKMAKRTRTINIVLFSLLR